MTSPSETFFAFGFVSTFVVALLATWFHYGVPMLVSLYRTLMYRLYNWNPSTSEKSAYRSQKVTDANLDIPHTSVV